MVRAHTVDVSLVLDQLFKCFDVDTRPTDLCMSMHKYADERTFAR